MSSTQAPTNAATRRAIGIDIGGTKIAIAAVDGTGRIHAQTEIATEAEQGFDRAVGRMVQASDAMLQQSGWNRRELCGLGVGCTGPVSPQTGIINNPYTLPTWVECDLVSALRGEFDRPVVLENDADAAAMGEWFAGAARGCSRVVMLTLGTGVGGGVVLDGQVYRGTRGEHPELGHIPIDPSGPECYCGTRGCLESLASGTAISAAGIAVGVGESRQVFQAAAAGDARAVAIVDRVRLALDMAHWTLLHTFLPECVVLGGGVGAEHFAWFAPSMEAQIPRATMVPPGSSRIVQAELGASAGVLGAASLVLREADA